ncbi:MAG: M48 family metalloprotease [Acidobacteriaceae bacterium]|nr:M48 family metalloprotease [Acidobacteriaceae bacterium]
MKNQALRLILAALAWQVPCVYARVELAPCKNRYSPEQQIELGQKAREQVYQQMPVLPDNSPITQYIQQLGNKLAAQAPGYKWPYNFHVVNDAEINAFALPGGTIFVNLGAIQAAANEAQLAGVMAHEISHVVLQHSICNLEKQQRVGLLAGLGQIAAGIALGGAVGGVAQQGIGMVTGLGFLKMSRGAEKEADLEGVGILYDAGYDPHGMPEFFQTIESKYGEGGAQFMSDHPNPGNRTEYINKEITGFVPRSNLITTSPEFARIKAQVSDMHAYTAQEISSGAWKRQNPYQTVGAGMNQTAGGGAAPDLNVSGGWKSFSGSGFSLQIPGNWDVYQGGTAAMIGPRGGIARSADNGAGNVIYGMLTDQYAPGGGVSGGAAMDALVSEITRDNPGVAPGRQSAITVNGIQGQSVQCSNPSGNNGRGEQDWIVAFPARNGSLRYFVFVAPTPDFEKMRPTFQRILQSLRM